MTIAFLVNIPSPYRVAFFNELGKYCELTVFFEKAKSDERDESWTKYRFENFKGVLLKGRSVSTDKAFAPQIKGYLKPVAFDRIVVCNAFTPTGIYAIQHMRRHGIPFWIEGDGAHLKKNNLIKKLFKTHVIKGAEGYFSTSDAHDRYYLFYGAKQNRIHRYPFTSVSEKEVLETPLSKSEKVELRNSLGIKEQNMLLTVGQFIYRKGFDVLLQSVCNMDRSIGVYMIGGTPTSEMHHFVKENKLVNVHFLPFQKPERLWEYYKASDLFVLPTREDIWGLVVNEAMAAGVPVVTTDKCIAGLEMVRNGVNGYIIPSENSAALRDAIVNVLGGDTYMMAAESLEMARKYTIESMAKMHMEVLKEH